MDQQIKFNIIIPCYNESAILQDTADVVLQELNMLRTTKRISDFEIIFIDDGSKDNTWKIIENICAKHRNFRGLKLLNNVGHQKALWAGYEYSVTRCDAVISIDADMQQDVSAIAHMVDRYIDGYDVVYGVRNNRQTDGVLKRIASQSFYKIMKLLGADVIPNHADYRLLSKNACKALLMYSERNIFIRGLVRLLGFKESNVFFDVKERTKGESQYTFSKMCNLAADGITSLSVRPLRLITLLGIVCVILSLIAALYVLISYFLGKSIPGWSSILLSIWFIGGVQVFAIGILGEYIGKIYTEVKRRPHYNVEKII